ncbi:MAG TPA: phage holin family protein [Capillimicrobium sp.]|nr:phage holin family protein [Capillimicrobium sp.]
MSADRDEQTTAQQGERPLGDAFAQFGEDVADSLRSEFEQLRAEAADRARSGARGAGYLAAAGVTGAVAAGAGLMLPILGLRRLLGPGATAVVVAAGAGSASAYLAKRGLEELGVPTEAAAERVKQAAKDAVGT